MRSRAGVVLRARGALRWPLSLLSPSLGSSRDQPPIFCLPSLFARRIAGTFEENTSGALRRAPAARRPARARPTDRPTDRPPARPPAAAARAPARPTAHVLSGPCVGPWVRGITERTFTGTPSRLRSRALFGASPVPFAVSVLARAILSSIREFGLARKGSWGCATVQINIRAAATTEGGQRLVDDFRRLFGPHPEILRTPGRLANESGIEDPGAVSCVILEIAAFVRALESLKPSFGDDRSRARAPSGEWPARSRCGGRFLARIYHVAECVLVCRRSRRYKCRNPIEPDSRDMGKNQRARAISENLEKSLFGRLA